ncbi:MAG: hypothetical protein IKD72_02390 [Clostridia bacterium]|nr:hypothetical protein [Clostridia bacterium]
MNETQKAAWKYCVVGNIVKTHIDENGILRYGTVAYSGGTKVYLCGKYWRFPDHTIGVIGLSRRGRQYCFNSTPVELIENVRLSRTYKPSVLKLMNHCEFENCWWHDAPEDRAGAEAFVAEWKKRFEKRKDVEA